MLGIKKAEVDQARQVIRENAAADGLFYVMNGLSTVIASYGLLADSPTSVIGAMIVATMGGRSTAWGSRWWRVTRGCCDSR